MDELTALRRLFFSLVAAPVVILVVLIFVVDELGAPRPGTGAAAVAAGAAGMAGAVWATGRPLAAIDPAALASSYRTNFFLGFAVAEGGLLLTFVLAFVEGQLWPCLVGLPFFLVAMALIAPSEANIERRQRDLMHAGSSLTLRDALRSSPPRV